MSCSYHTDGAGAFTLTYSGDSCVVRDSTLQAVSSGFTWYVDEACDGDMNFTVWSPTKSSSPDGTQFTFEFTPDGAGRPMAGSAAVTFVEWETETLATWPIDRNRKTVGVREKVAVVFDPSISLGHGIKSSFGGVLVAADNGYEYVASTNACHDKLCFTDNDGGALDITFQVLEPSGYEIVALTSDCLDIPNIAGNFSLYFDLRLVPTNVSFKGNVEVIEVSMVSTNATGYFTAPYCANMLDHGLHGAGEWVPVSVDGNQFASPDEVSPGCLFPPFSDGSFTWPIPNNWRIIGDTSEGRKFCNEDQHFAITSSGSVGVWKFSKKGVRELNSNVVITTDEAIP